MIVTCTNCTARLQLEDAKLPSRPFTVRCPKCQSIINAQPPSASGDGSALSVAGDLPTSLRGQRESKPVAAPPMPAESSSDLHHKPQHEAPAETDVLRLLSSLLQKGLTEGGTSRNAPGRRWTHRRALVCTGRAHRETLARVLSQSQCEVFVADDTRQAIERMREDQMDVIFLDNDFDSMEQGAAYINREVNSLRPAERRRLFFVHLLPNARTADPLAAFLNHVNLVVNPQDLADLPRVIERSVRDFNELYRDFNKALNLTDL